MRCPRRMNVSMPSGRAPPRPERSVRTSPWLRRIAVTTVAGKRWQRVHIVEHLLSEYLCYEIEGYVESATGEEISIADRAAHPDLARLGPDFWLLTPSPTGPSRS
jgi:hypothetical protein